MFSFISTDECSQSASTANFDRNVHKEFCHHLNFYRYQTCAKTVQIKQYSKHTHTPDKELNNFCRNIQKLQTLKIGLDFWPCMSNRPWKKIQNKLL